MTRLILVISLVFSVSTSVHATSLCYTRDLERAPTCILQPHYEGSICSTDEAILFSCRILNRNKTLSICGSQKITESTGYIQYRFGTNAKVDLFFPKTKHSPLGLFIKKYSASYGAGLSTVLDASITFTTGQHTYIVYSNWVNGSTDAVNNDSHDVYGYHSGVKVYKNLELISDLKCDQDRGWIGAPEEVKNNFPDFLK